jgi:C-terminus of AA_permease
VKSTSHSRCQLRQGDKENGARITWLRFGIWLVIGLVIYAVYGVRHALAAHQPNASRA